MSESSSHSHKPGALSGARRKYRLRRRLFNSLETPVGASNHHHACHHGEEVQEAEQQAHELHRQLQETHDQLLRARADLENQRRRHLREKDELRKYATEQVVRDLMPAMDHFALALQSFQGGTDVESLRQGVEMIHRELIGVLQGNGLSEIAPAGQVFDPARHEAVATDNQPDREEGEVLEVLRAGWELNGRVLRPALVKVNKLA